MKRNKLFTLCSFFFLLLAEKGISQGNCSFVVVDEMTGSLKLPATLVLFNDEGVEILKKVRPDGTFDLSSYGEKLQVCVRYMIQCDNKDYWPIKGTGPFPCTKDKLKAIKKPDISSAHTTTITITKPKKLN
jgi:hypothetical protein